MCRIFGFFSENSGKLCEEMPAVSAAQIHGGPDEQKWMALPQMGIGANRLSIVDPAHGHQPYEFQEKIYAVLNGEIYNHQQLRADLVVKGYSFEGGCDGEIIPALYVEYGDEFVSLLDGMFSIAILDLRAIPRLTIVSDPAGIKPLYYSWNSQYKSLCFASEIPGLFQFSHVSRECRYEAIDHYLTARAIYDNKTFFKEVEVLEPSSILSIRLGETPQLRSYQSAITWENTELHSVQEAGEELKLLLAREISQMIVADASICTVNSGGLDSSLITALAFPKLDNPKAFHLSYHGSWPFDERPFARLLRPLYPGDHQEILVAEEELPELFLQAIKHLGQPNAAPHALSAFALFKAIAETGCRVALIGEGSDEMFGGYDRMRAAATYEGDWINFYLDKLGPTSREIRAQLYSPSYTKFLHENGTAHDSFAQLLREGLPGSRVDKLRAFETSLRLPHYVLHRAEPMGLAHGVEVRVPFCQPRILDFSRKVSSRYTIGSSRGKEVVYQAGIPLLPSGIINRPKQAFTLPIGAMMYPKGPLLSFLKEIILSDVLINTGAFCRDGLESVIKKQEENPCWDNAFVVWSLGVLSYCLELYR
jgi:asparagine synthase (glutamine-hydrolysing)